MKPVISLHDVGVKYKLSGKPFRKKQYFEALKSISFDINRGEAFGIIGMNGVGKSTILRIISGVIQPDTGKCVNHGVSVSLLALQAVFYPNLNGRDNAIMAGLLQGHAYKNIVSKIDEIHEYSELGDFFYEPTRTYSSGMKARLGFSTNVFINSDVLLIDEALSAGDTSFGKKAQETMVEKIKSKQTVVLVTHSQKQLEDLCDRAVLIDGGISVFTGECGDVVKLYNERIKISKASKPQRTA